MQLLKQVTMVQEVFRGSSPRHADGKLSWITSSRTTVHQIYRIGGPDLLEVSSLLPHSSRMNNLDKLILRRLPLWSWGPTVLLMETNIVSGA